ncbi:hypothetical protein FLX27_07375 [Agrobacterium tumefaciens]|nr:hypothetical protein FLX27_07375 [Agrobacterium tumefaciens]
MPSSTVALAASGFSAVWRRRRG